MMSLPLSTFALTLADHVALALLAPLALWTLESHLCRSLGVPKILRPGYFRSFERLTNYRTEMVSSLCLDFLLLHAVWKVWASGAPLWLSLGFSLAVFGLILFMFYPATMPATALFSLFLRNEARMYMDKQRHFPGSSRLEQPEVWRRIRTELDRFIATHPLRGISDYIPDITVHTRSSETIEQPWKVLWLRVLGIDVPSGAAKMPFLASLLDEVGAYSCFLSVLEPGAELHPHRGPHNGILRYHLPLLVKDPSEQWLICDGHTHHWREGEGILFDNYAVHEVGSRSTAVRVVLIVDVPRKFDSRVLTVLNTFLVEVGRRHPVFHGFRRRQDIYEAGSLQTRKDGSNSRPFANLTNRLSRRRAP